MGVIATGPLVAAAQDKKPSERFLEEAPKAWAEIEARASRLHVVGVEWKESRGVTNGFVESSRSRFEVKVAPGGRALSVGQPEVQTVIRGAGPPEETARPAGYCVVKGFNPDEAFWLVRKADGTPFVSMVAGNREAHKRAVEADIQGYAGFVWQPASFWYFRGTPPDPNFRLGKVEEVAIDGRVYVRVAYEHQVDVRGQPYVYHDAWALFDPSRRWAAKAYGMRVGPNKETALRTEIVYGPTDCGYPVPRSYVLTSVSPGAFRRVERTFETWTYDVEFPVADFRLSAFGPLGGGR